MPFTITITLKSKPSLGRKGTLHYLSATPWGHGWFLPSGWPVSELRDYQSAAVDSLRPSLAQGHRASCFVLPTGAGKTQITFHLIRFKAMEADEAQRCEVDRDLQRVHRCDWEMHEVWQLFSELQAIAAQYGYQPGWVAHKFREKVGVWPNPVKDAPAVEPSLETMAWGKSENLRFAKRASK